VFATDTIVLQANVANVGWVSR